MPLFEYKCEKCGHVAEFLESASSGKKHECDNCGAIEMKKLLSGFAVGRSTSSQSACCRSCPSGPYPNDMCGGGMCGMK